jgi:hypothetical protein
LRKKLKYIIREEVGVLTWQTEGTLGGRGFSVKNWVKPARDLLEDEEARIFHPSG